MRKPAKEEPQDLPPDDVDDAEAGPARPSRSQLKRDAEELQKLGVMLVDVPRDELKRWDLPPELLEAVLQGQAMGTARSGKRRQMQFIGKQMRLVDATHIRKLLDARGQRGQLEGEDNRLLEGWRKRLLEDTDDVAIMDLEERHPNVDINHVRALVEKARREQSRKQPPHAFRELFRVLREGILGAAD